jgi:GNAT superfamily N-acetyltransferase
MRWKKGDYFISDDKSLADYDFIHQSIITTYWGEKRSFDKMRTACENVVLLCMFKGEKQVGFARIISDGACVSLLHDVFVDPGHRGHGLGKWLVKSLLEHPSTQTDRVLLLTSDAHGLYEQFGFHRIEGKAMGMSRGKELPTSQ